jgi:hypothetical protein
MEVGIGVASSDEINNKRLYPEIVSESKLVIKKKGQSFISDSSIVENIVNVFKSFFDNQILGKTIEIDKINTSILGINGIESFFTKRVVNGETIVINGLSLMVFNPIYSAPKEDIQIINQSLFLPFFKSPYYGNYDVLKGNIVIE